MKAIIVGGGIGGLTTALMLRSRGISCELYEQSETIRELGVGINTLPHAIRELAGLGLLDRLDEVAIRTYELFYLTRHGQQVWHEKRGLDAGHDVPQFSIHRGRLQGVIHQAVVERLGADAIRTGCRLGAFTQDEGGVSAHFFDRAGCHVHTARGDILIGADGIHSRVRQLLFGIDRPHFTGCIAYRGLVPAERLAHLDLEVTSNSWWGPGGHFVHYYVAGGRLVNFVAVQEEETWTRESWNERGEVADALRLFEGWHPQVRTIIGAVDETFKWGLFDREPLPRWSVGRITLLGDSCHAMLPFMAQGAVQSIEDGATLTACLVEAGGDVAGALARYELLRKPRTTRLQEMSRHNKTRFHLPDGVDQQRRDAQTAAAGDRSIAAVGWLYAHDAGVLPDAAA
ncbi:MAG TPA: FAD-dependent monooxygenase [Vineibacter sp.]|nr:FAD-dependent monooxygenase [Vineibacter sp.]